MGQLVTPWCFHILFRLMIMTRGALVSMIYSKLLQTKVNTTDQSTAFTLMTTDVEKIVETFWQLILMPWSGVLQIAICTYLLYRQVGAVCCVPLLVIFGESRHVQKNRSISIDVLLFVHQSPLDSLAYPVLEFLVTKTHGSEVSRHE